MTLGIVPLSDALGAEVVGPDWSRAMDSRTLAELNAAFFEYHLLCFRSEPLAPLAFARLARCFGEPKVQLIGAERQAEAPEVSRLETTYGSAADKPEDMRKVRLSGWHTDDSYFPVPAKATLLQALAVPESGGETRFANMRAAYEDLPEGLKARIEGLDAIHRYETRRATAPPTELTREEQAETQDAVHPLVRIHEETGEKAIYFNANRTDRIVGLSERESDSLLDQLHEHTIQPKYQYHHSWRLGDIVLWDNRCLIHSVNMDFPVGQRRVHQRILLAGTLPASAARS
jgi:taurine dioxygenase